MGWVFQMIGEKLVPLMHAFFFLVSMLLMPQYGCYISAFVFRLQRDAVFSDKNEKETEYLAAEPELLSECEDVAESGGLNGETVEGEEEEEERVEYLKFKFPGLEEFIMNHPRTGDFNAVNLIGTFLGEEDQGSNVHFPVENRERVGDGESRGIGNGNGEGMAFELLSEEDHSVKEVDESHGNEGVESRNNSPGKNSTANNSDSSSLNFEHFSDKDYDGESEDEEVGSVETPQLFDSSDEEKEEEEETEAYAKTEQEHFFTLTDENDALKSQTDDHAAGFLTKHDPNSSKTESNDSEKCDSTEADELESLWEHQDLIDQLKMELKKVRATGLPTILEESEPPKIADDLKPWKLDEKLHREDRMGNLHKVHKCYRERMRKLDILNYQKMYATGFLQLKAPDHLLRTHSERKPWTTTLKSLVVKNVGLLRNKVQGADSVRKMMEEVEGDVEVVYVGQMCLSWEILRWQYEKVLDLWDSDPRGILRFNEVAGEFQQFQVLMQRFIEDEPFQGRPRVQHYSNSRRLHRNLLQVPVVRADNMRDKKWKGWSKGGRDDEYVITSELLVEIVQESIRIFWQFVKADKDCNITSINTLKKMPQLSDPEDLKLLLALRKDVQKKERKMKEILRSESCILRRLSRRRDNTEEEEWDHQVLAFFSEVDMRLVCRVLRMSRMRKDQLRWCHDKLERISFVNSKMCIQPSFLVFPC